MITGDVHRRYVGASVRHQSSRPAAVTDALRDQLQTTLGAAYTLERELGGGGMSRVFVAEETRFRRRVVLKVLAPELAQGLSAVRFEREIGLAATLQEPHIVPVLSAGDVGGLPWYSMPFVAGESLRERLRRGPVPAGEAVSILRDVARALAYAHAQGVVHRDVKPANVLLSSGTAVVTDFGIAKALQQARTAVPDVPALPADGLTQVGMPLGTPAYMAPEQAAGDPATDHRADLYAWGVVAYELLAGRHPFAGKTSPQAMMVAHFAETPAPLPTAIPHPLATLVARCLAKDPVHRPADAAEMLRAVDAVAPTPAAPPDVGRAGPAPTIGASTPRVAEDRSLVVLPFANLSPDPENAYFSDGLTEELIADLGRLRALRVISRTSAMAYRGTERAVRDVATELGVRYVLEGSVRRAGAQLRITARLVDAVADAQVWADKYGGTLDDVFDLQERVSRDIVRALDVTLSTDEDRRLGDRPIGDAAAYDCWLRARHEIARASDESLAHAAGLLRRGLEIVPGNPRLRAALAVTEVVAMRTRGETDHALLARAAAEADEVSAEAPGAGGVHSLLGFLAFERGEMQAAATHYARAISADPQDSEAGAWLGIVFLYVGHTDAARRLFDRLRRDDPLYLWPHGLASVVDWFEGRPADGLAAMERCLALGADGPIWRWHWGYLLALLGRHEELAAEAARLAEREPEHPYVRHLLALAAILGGTPDAAAVHLAALATMPLDPHLTFHVGECHALLGDTERALSLVESAGARGFHPAAFVARHDPFLAGVRAHPRFAAVAVEAERRQRAFVV
jgi:serine/threonine-protein kinase